MTFVAITTDRLILRPLTEDDIGPLAHRRSDPLVAKYQNWVKPFPRERAERMVTSIMEMDGPANEEWYMVAIDELASGAIVGDLSLHMTWEMRTAEVGYNLSPAFWGRGYASEAVAALVDWLVEGLGVTRVFGMLHPDNLASAQVLERTGFLFEGHTRQSYWDGDECSDDWIYGLTRADHQAWIGRPRQRPTTVSLVPIDHTNDQAALSLATHRSQRVFVAPMECNLANAPIPEIVNGTPVVPWLRGIEADDELAGFVMLALPTAAHPEPFLWRFLVDRIHQRRGIGALALNLVVEECKSIGATTLLTSWVPGRGSPEPFYLAFGFEPTGNIVGGETEARLTLD